MAPFKILAAFKIIGLGAVLAVLLSAGWQAPAEAQAGMWAIETNACTSDGSRCIKGLVNTGPPFATAQECEKKAQQLAREYHQANLKVMFIRCVQLRH